MKPLNLVEAALFVQRFEAELKKIDLYSLSRQPGLVEHAYQRARGFDTQSLTRVEADAEIAALNRSARRAVESVKVKTIRARRKKPSAAAIRKLHVARDAYFRKMGYGRYAKKSKKKAA